MSLIDSFGQVFRIGSENIPRDEILGGRTISFPA